MIHQTFSLWEHAQASLTTYILNQMPGGEKQPLILICPGGGFLSCNPLEGKCVALHFNREGFHAAVLCYSTKQSAPESCTFPQPLFDLAEAVKLIRMHAAEWRVDTDRIVLLGFSAGGNVCALYENCWNQRTIEQGFLRMMNLAQFGKEEPEEPDILNNSPIFHINSDTPPTFL